jgi:hypothetical protein
VQIVFCQGLYMQRHGHTAQPFKRTSADVTVCPGSSHSQHGRLLWEFQMLYCSKETAAYGR